MKWEKTSHVKPEDRQICLVRTMVQLSFFENESECLNASTYLCFYKSETDSFHDVATKKKIKNPMYWCPADNSTKQTII